MDIKKRSLIVILSLFTLLLLSMSLASAQDTVVIVEVVVNGYVVHFDGSTYDAAADTTSFAYTVTGTGVSPALSFFDLEIPTCDVPLEVAAYSPVEGVTLGTDPITGIDGIKWDLPLAEDGTRSYSVTFSGEVNEGQVLAAVKASNGFIALNITGPACPLPEIQVEKFVSADGSDWDDANEAPGLEIEEVGSDVFFKFVVTNTGNATLTGISLTDDTVDVSACVVEDTLEPGDSFECVVGPFDAEEGAHTNIATAAGVVDGEAVSDTDTASYFGGDMEEELPIVIIIEGPVSGIRGNVVIIYGFEFEFDDDDPMLMVIHLGDIIRINGTTLDTDGAFVIIAIFIDFISVEIFIGDDGVIWRDPGNCQNAPPPRAPAHGWRRRCEPGGSGRGSRS